MATNSKDNGSSQAASERDKAIELALGAIEKQFGKGSIMRLDKQQPVAEVKVVPTGSLGLDIALGIGGLPRGRVVEVYGPESSGKTTLTLHVVAQAQKNGGVAAFIDAEHALDVGYARKLGVKTDELLVSQPDCGEQALEIADMLVRSNAIDIIVIDSVAALTPRAELEGEMGDAHVGLQARLMSQALRKLTAAISRSNCIVVFINQIRMKIGVMFGSPETTTGGNALKFYSSVRLDIRRIGAIKNGESVVGNRTRVKVVKNKLAAPFREVEFDIVYGEGVSREGELIDLATAANIVEKSGAWLSYEGERIGQGRENAKVFLREHADIYAAIETRVLAQHDIRRPGGQPDGKNEGKPDGKNEGKPDGKNEGKPEGKNDAKAEGKAEARPAAKPDARSEAKDDAGSPNGSAGAAGKPAPRRPTASA